MCPKKALASFCPSGWNECWVPAGLLFQVTQYEIRMSHWVMPAFLRFHSVLWWRNPSQVQGVIVDSATMWAGWSHRQHYVTLMADAHLMVRQESGLPTRFIRGLSSCYQRKQAVNVLWVINAICLRGVLSTSWAFHLLRVLLIVLCLRQYLFTHRCVDYAIWIIIN